MRESLRTKKLKNLNKLIVDEIIKSVTVLPGDLLDEIENAVKNSSAVERKVLEGMVENSRIAKEKGVPLCQDTGIFEIWVHLGRKSILRNININSFIKEAVREAQKKGRLRDSMSGQTEPVVHIKTTEEEHSRLTITPRGFGSENHTKLHMLSPVVSFKDIKETVVKDVRSANAMPCPPYIIGIGIGGTASKAIELSTEALTEINFKPSKKEKEILKDINSLGYGAGGMGGNLTALGVKIKEFPSHIAGKALGVHIGCWSNRVRRVLLEND